MRSDLPTSTVTFLFTDVEGSSELLRELGAEAYADALAEHRRVVREACAAQGGVEVDTQGDAFFVAFPSAPGAASAAQAITDALERGRISLRIGLHTGTPLVTDEGYVGNDVHFAARVAASGHGGQILLSSSVRELVDGLPVTDLGEHRLKDIEGAVSIYQLGEQTFPPLKTISNTNLPRPASSFVGRERELADVLARFERGTRLLTLTGPGGSGKTRLAVEAATTLVPLYKAGVFWVGLASLRESSLVTETIAQTLGATDDLDTHIGDRAMLLLLDNLEQVIEAAPGLSGLLQACPNLTLLCTSRELLRVQGEVEYQVPPLASAEAVDLFCERSELEPSEEIAELCAGLDSLPLAVELAAARTKALTPTQILDRLSDRLDLLKGGRDADARQQTLRATIAWSYDLLSEEEQRAFRSLSVFAGGCTLEAAEAVAEASIDMLQSLVEKSLLRFTNERYWMLETVREYAADTLADAQELRRRHARFYTEVAVAFELALQGSGQAPSWTRLSEEYQNVRGALAWACGTGGDAHIALELVRALRRFWWQRGAFREGELWCRSALAVSAEEPPADRARAIRALSNMALGAGDPDTSLALLDECFQVARAERDADLELGVLIDRVIVYQDLGYMRLASQTSGEAIELARALGDASAVATASLNLGYLLLFEGDHSRAAELFHVALDTIREIEGEQAAAVPLGNLAIVALREGELALGAAQIRESIVLFRETGEVPGIVCSLIVAGALLAFDQESAVAVTALAVSTSLREEIALDLATMPVEARINAETLSALRARFGEAEFETLWSRGSRPGDREELLNEVLSSLASRG